MYNTKVANKENRDENDVDIRIIIVLACVVELIYFMKR